MSEAARRAFERRLREVYDAEATLVAGLRRMARSASSDELKKAFLAHVRVTEKQIDRLKKVFSNLDKQPRRRACEPIAALVERAAGVAGDGAAADLELISVGLMIEQTELAFYKELIKLAVAQGHNRAVSKLEKNMGEEENASTELEGLLLTVAGG